MSIDLTTLTISKAHKALVAGEYTAVELAQAYLDVIKVKNPNINAYLEVYDDVIAQAQVAMAQDLARNWKPKLRNSQD